MLTIRLTRIGRKNDPKYRFIVAEKRSKRDGKFIDRIGFYDPMLTPAVLTIDDAKLQNWLSKGAKLSEGAYKLLKKRVKNASDKIE